MKDAAGIARVHVESWRGAYRGLLPDEILDRLSISHRTDQWRRWLAPGGKHALTVVAEATGALVAFSTLAIPSRDAEEPADVGEIPALYVAPGAWGLGAGGALMAASVEAMRERGCRESILWMLDGNDRAKAFYLRQGWRGDGGRRGSQYFPGAPGLVEVRFRRGL